MIKDKEAQYLAKLLRRYDGDVASALAAYRVGRVDFLTLRQAHDLLSKAAGSCRGRSRARLSSTMPPWMSRNPAARQRDIFGRRLLGRQRVEIRRVAIPPAEITLIGRLHVVIERAIAIEYDKFHSTLRR